MPKPGTCEKCRAPVLRCATPARAQVVSIDPEPVYDGDHVLLRGHRYPLALPLNWLDPRNDAEYEYRFLELSPLRFRIHQCRTTRPYRKAK